MNVPDLGVFILKIQQINNYSEMESLLPCSIHYLISN